MMYIYSAVVPYKYAFVLNSKSGTGKPNSTFLTFIIFFSFFEIRGKMARASNGNLNNVT